MGIHLLWSRSFFRLPMVRWLFLLFALGMIVCSVAALAYVRGKLMSRRENKTASLPVSPPSGSAWQLVPAFPGLRFVQPVIFVPLTDGSGQGLVLERGGTIQLIDTATAANSKQLVLDLSPRTACTPYCDDGAIGLVLHPDFARMESPRRGHLFVLYTARADGKVFDRLSRFIFDFDRRRITPESEQILIDQFDEHSDHNGGALAFGPDGFLYVGVGDEGGDGDPYGNAQRIDRDLFSGILRLDVDCRGGELSQPPRRQPATGRTANYFIPRDNPFHGVPNALAEFWSVGLRNPHRMAFDAETGKLWVGEVGHLLREEIEIASRGSNHQWSYREGRVPLTESYLHGQRPVEFYGIETPPAWEYPHVNGNNCVIGGYVYRGDLWPELYGQYLFADNASGRLFAAEHDGEQICGTMELASVRASSKAGIASVDPDLNGEPLIIVLGELERGDGEIYRLSPANPGQIATLPRRLSETGLFRDLRTLTPQRGVIPYDVNVPHWADGATQKHWIMVPGQGRDPESSTDCVEYSPTDAWRFPTGTTFVQHFELPIDERDATRLRRVETRILVRDSLGKAFGLTYKWNAEGTEAELLDDMDTESIAVQTSDGGMRHQLWQFPSRQMCVVCHNEKAEYVLGANARQLNRDYHYSTLIGTHNQLQHWNRIGMFTRVVTSEELASAPRLCPAEDSTVDLTTRVRSYLDANCAACHRPGGMARAHFDARFSTPLDLQNLIRGPLFSTEAIAGAMAVRPSDPARSMLVYRLQHSLKRMPPVGVSRRDSAAIRLLSDWIDTLPVPPDIDYVPDEDELEAAAATPIATSDVKTVEVGGTAAQ